MLRRLSAERGCPAALRRPALRAGSQVASDVRGILAQVRDGGDAALRELGRRYDGVEVQQFAVSEAEREAARREVGTQARADLQRAHDQIRTFHLAQVTDALSVETAVGIRCEQRTVPIARVGAYVPGGTAPLFSTLLMIGVPAAIAGCELRIVCTPPRADGTLDPHVLVAADLCGIESVYKIGGAQAVAAMAYGTESVPRVDKLFGPGNAWVTAAKTQVASDPDAAAIDLPAGPSEVLVIADEAADPAFVATDLLSQAEHGPDSQVVLVTNSETLAERVCAELETRLAKLPRRAVAERSLSASCLVIVADLVQAFAISNDYAPEHLVLQVREPRAWLERIQNAGSVFVGPWSPESIGDYASGTNHVLPTYGHARAHSGLGVSAFQKTISIQELTPTGLQDIGPVVERLSALEGLHAHAEAVAVRLQRLRERAEQGA